MLVWISAAVRAAIVDLDFIDQSREVPPIERIAANDDQSAGH